MTKTVGEKPSGQPVVEYIKARDDGEKPQMSLCLLKVHYQLVPVCDVMTRTTALFVYPMYVAMKHALSTPSALFQSTDSVRNGPMEIEQCPDLEELTV